MAEQATPRFPVLNESDFTPDQKKLAERVSRFSLTPQKVFRGPLGLLLRAPNLGQAFLQLGEYLRFHTGIDDRFLELAVITHAWFWNDPYEWAIHYDRAIKKGVAREIVEAIRVGAEPEFTDGTEAAVYRFTRQLIERRQVDDETFDAIRQAFGEEGIASLTVFIGNYAMLSDVIAVCRLAPHDNGAPAMERPQHEPDLT